jgi:hypothetical protein
LREASIKWLVQFGQELLETALQVFEPDDLDVDAGKGKQRALAILV